MCATSLSPLRRKHTHIGTLLLALLAGLLRRHVLLVHQAGDLAKHDSGVAVEERDAGEALAVLEGVDDERLLGHEDDLRHLVRLERVGVLHLMPPVSLPTLKSKPVARQAERPQRTKPIG